MNRREFLKGAAAVAAIAAAPAAVAGSKGIIYGELSIATWDGYLEALMPGLTRVSVIPGDPGFFPEAIHVKGVYVDGVEVLAVTADIERGYVDVIRDGPDGRPACDGNGDIIIDRIYGKVEVIWPAGRPTAHTWLGDVDVTKRYSCKPIAMSDMENAG